MNKVVILAGGRGSRLGDVGETIPKPMVKIGELPIIEHIMNKFLRDVGRCQFIVAGGYRCDVLQSYFDGRENVNVIYTGNETNTAGRINRLQQYLDEPFYMCYGDGLTDFGLNKLKDVGCVNMLVIHPISRFGELDFNDVGKVIRFNEKPISTLWINGGFFKVNPSIFNYIQKDNEDLATDVFPRLVIDENLYAIPYDGYWHCMDTPKDLADLNEQYKSGHAQWLR